MEAIIERCCGLDVHQAQVTACLLEGRPGQRAKKIVRKFRTFTRDLLAMRDWLREAGCRPDSRPPGSSGRSAFAGHRSNLRRRAEARRGHRR
jgi:hypothetical protein